MSATSSPVTGLPVARPTIERSNGLDPPQGRSRTGQAYQAGPSGPEVRRRRRSEPYAFSGSLAFDPPARQEDWTLEVFEANRADGSVRYSVELPVKVGG